MGPEVAANLDLLMAHAGWVERLARSLVLDPNAADDVVQAVWLEALERPPRDTGDARGWLGTVARNAARKLVRGEKRRRHREELAAQAERLGDSTQLVDRAVLHRDLVDRVIALDEPYREVVLLRFFEELSTTEIARRLERPRNTVQTQLQRGLERLRVRLDREYGDREAWGLALLPLGLSPRAGQAAALGTQGSFFITLGGWIMTLKGMLALVATVLVAAVGWQISTRSIETPAEPAASSSLASSDLVQPDALDAAAPRETRTALPVESAVDPTADSVTQPAPGTAVQPLRGMLVDVAGQPLAGLRVAWQARRGVRLEGNHLTGELPTTRSSESYLHTIELTDEMRRLIDEHPQILDELVGDFSDPAAARMLILHGTPPAPTATTAADGRFVLLRDTEDGDVTLEDDRLVLLDGGLARTRTGEEPERLVVATHTVSVSGTVVDAHGTPVPEANVSSSPSIRGIPDFPFAVEQAGSLHYASARTSRDGRFQLEGVPWVPGGVVSAARSGFISTEEPLPAAGATELTLVLKEQDSRRFVRGRVTLADGSPATRAYVALGQDRDNADERGEFEIEITSLWEGAPLLAHQKGLEVASIEGFADELRANPGSRDGIVLVLGQATKTLRGRVLDADGDPVEGLQIELVDPTYYGPNTSDPIERTGVLTGARGEFLLEELQGRDYRVRVIDPRTLLTVDSEPVAAGTEDLVVRLPVDATYPAVRGRVVSSTGQPLPGVEVAFGIYTRRVGRSSTSRKSSAVETDDLGHFVLPEVPRSPGFLTVGGPLVRIEHYESDTLDLSRPVELVARQLFLFRVELPADDSADAFAFLNDHEQPVTVWALLPTSTSAFDELEATPGAPSPTLVVTDEAVALVLYREGEELRRIRVTGVAGEIVPLRP